LQNLSFDSWENPYDSPHIATVQYTLRENTGKLRKLGPVRKHGEHVLLGAARAARLLVAGLQYKAQRRKTGELYCNFGAFLLL